MSKTVIEMAKEAGLHLYVNDLTEEPYALIVERFAELVRADEREACAQVCDDLPAPDSWSGSEVGLWDVATLECGDVIRARSNTRPA